MLQRKLREAIREAIQTEKDAMDYYQAAAERMVNEHARLTFQILAREEREHALSFYRIYEWNDIPPFDELISAPANRNSSWWAVIAKQPLGRFDERQALQEAIRQEQLLEEKLLAMADEINDRSIRAVYLANARSTHHHLEVVRDDFENLIAING